MRLALAVPQTLPDWRANLEGIDAMCTEAAQAGAQFIVFSEAAVTGFFSRGDPLADFALGQAVPGPASAELSRIASERRLWLAAGMFEREGERLYDSALLFAPDGSLRLHYRRMDPHWHPFRPLGSGPYTQGTSPRSTQTPLGSCSFLLCGDLFSAVSRARLRALRPRWLILPMARGFDEDVANASQWDAEERYYYVREAQRLGVGLIVVNQLATLAPHAYFGGAMVVSRQGEILLHHPLGYAGVSLVELETP